MKNSLEPKVKPQLRLRKILIYTAIASALTALLWKLFLGTAATVVNPGNVLGMFTPSNGPQINNYSWEKVITIDNTRVMDTVDLIDFPLLVSITDPALRSVANGGSVQSDQGYDILFCGANYAQLDHEIESYDPVTGAYVAWVRLPVLYHDVDTELGITCGNSSITSDPSTENTWNAFHEGVWHMSDSPSGLIDDAAGNFEGQPYNMNNADLVNGKISKALDFDGVNDYIAIKNKKFNSPGAIQQMTVSGWVKTSENNGSWTSNWSLLDFDRSEYFNFFVHGQGKASFCTRGQNSGINDFHAGQNGQVNDGEWHHLVGVFDGSKKYIYIDGVLSATENNPHNGNMIGSGFTRYGIIGDGSEASTFNGSRNQNYYKGKIDELRLLNIGLSSGWIATEYNNQSSPETFYSLGEPFNLPIELLTFSADLQENEVLVKWETASQRNNDYFTIERSTDGKEFENVGEVDGAGNSNEVLSYSFTDEDPAQGLSYYRLRQTDYDGATEAFFPVAINYIVPVDEVLIDRVYPNPFTNSFTLEYSMSAESEIELILVNSGGTQVFSDLIYSNEGKNTYVYTSDGDLMPGMYIMSLLQDGRVMGTSKLMKR